MPPKLPGRRPPALPTQRLVLAAADVTGIPAGQRRPRSTATPGQCLHRALASRRTVTEASYPGSEPTVASPIKAERTGEAI